MTQMTRCAACLRPFESGLTHALVVQSVGFTAKPAFPSGHCTAQSLESARSASRKQLRFRVQPTAKSALRISPIPSRRNKMYSDFYRSAYGLLTKSRILICILVLSVHSWAFGQQRPIDDQLALARVAV